MGTSATRRDKGRVSIVMVLFAAGKPGGSSYPNTEVLGAKYYTNNCCWDLRSFIISGYVDLLGRRPRANAGLESFLSTASSCLRRALGRYSNLRSR